jgi:hypothetical protein
MTPTTTSAKRKHAGQRRFVLTALTLVLLVAGAPVGWMVYRHFSQDRLLRTAIAETEALDPHWRMEAIEAHRAAVPDDENSAAVIRHVRAMLTRPAPGVMQEREVVLRDLKPEVRLTDQQFRTVIDALEDVERAIGPALSLARFPRGRHPITYTPDGVSTLLPHVDDLRQVQWQVLQYLPLVHAHEGDGERAARSCLALLNLGRSMGDEPCVISQLVRQRHFLDAGRALERVLGQVEVPEPTLALLHRELAAEAAYDPWESAVRGERAMLYLATEAVRTGLLKTSIIRGMVSCSAAPSTAVERVRLWFNDRFPINVRSAQAQVLRICNRLQGLARLPWPEQLAAVEALAAEQETVAEPVSQFLPELVKYIKVLHFGRARGQCTVAAVAAERYRMKHGQWPGSLIALVPEFLAQAPVDPYDGRPLHYRRLADGVVIYSVGPDGSDDGGNLSENLQSPEGIDIGVRLWDPDRRGQAPSAP